jgi:hypothetical protein
VRADRLTLLLRDLADAGAGSAVMAMSPHLDDAVLSCGALLAQLDGRTGSALPEVYWIGANDSATAA